VEIRAVGEGKNIHKAVELPPGACPP
jgi:hypothetical protein